MVQVSGPSGRRPDNIDPLTDEIEDEIKAALGGIVSNEVSSPPRTWRFSLDDYCEIILFKSIIKYGKEGIGGEDRLLEKKPDTIVARARQLLDTFHSTDAVGELAKQRDEYRRKQAKDLEPLIIQFLQDTAHDTYEQKKIVCRFVTLVLEGFGLAIRCPKTGRASLLQADSGSDPRFGRFQIYHRSDAGKPLVTVSSPSLTKLFEASNAEQTEAINLQLMPDDFSRSLKAQGESWTERSGGHRRQRHPGA